MSKTFVAPTKQDFVDIFPSGRFEVPDGWRQYAYIIPLKYNFRIQISTTIDVSGKHRGVGKNAIDIVLFRNDNMIRGTKKVLRTSGWQKRVKNRVNKLVKSYKQDAFNICINMLNAPSIKSDKINKIKEKLFSTDNREKIIDVILNDKNNVRKTIESILSGENKKPKKKKKEIKKDLPIIRYKDQPENELTIIEVDGHHELHPCSNFEHMKFPFMYFNPIQSAALEYVDKDVNLVVAVPTSAGKTTIAEMFISDALSRNAKGIFLSPLKAVSQEKYDDWTDGSHDWSDRNVEILTGDYVLTESKKKRLHNADIIIKTTEMLDSKSRKINSEGNSWLLRCLCLVCDEAHLLTTNRGDAVETGIMRFTEQNPHARIVLLSATMPNVQELGEWLTVLNGKPTVVIKSSWRPTQLDIEYVKYPSVNYYHRDEETKRQYAIDILKKYPEDKFIVFAHSKTVARQMYKDIMSFDKRVSLHNADLSKEKRNKTERKFKDNNSDLRIIVSTPTLAWGANLPARRVIILGINRGLQKVEPLDIIQMAGRAGRLGLDPKGNSYILLPSKDFNKNVEYYSKSKIIESQLRDLDVLAFHITSEIAEDRIETISDVQDWYRRSFAHFQGKILPISTSSHQDLIDGSNVSIEKVLDSLIKHNILRQNEDGKIKATQLGKVSSWLYYSPFDVAYWSNNMKKVSQLGKERVDEFIAWMLGNIKSNFSHYIPRASKSDLSNISWILGPSGIGGKIPVHVLVYLDCLKGRKNHSLISLQRGIQYDIDRQISALKLIDQRVNNCFDEDYFNLLSIRVKHGVSWDAASLCKVDNIGGKRAEALIDHGVNCIEDIINSKDLVQSLFGKKIAAKIIKSSKQLVNSNV